MTNIEKILSEREKLNRNFEINQTLLNEVISAINAINSLESASDAVMQACIAMGIEIWNAEPIRKILEKIYDVAHCQKSAPQLSVFIQEIMLPNIKAEIYKIFREEFLKLTSHCT